MAQSPNFNTVRKSKLSSATFDADDDQAYAYGSSASRFGSDEARYITGDDDRDDAPEHLSYEERGEGGEESPIKAERNRNRTGEDDYEPGQRNAAYPPRQNGAYDDERYFSGQGKRHGRDENVLARDGDRDYGRGRQLHRDDSTRPLRGGSDWRRLTNDDDNDA